MRSYRRRLHDVLAPAERRLFARLDTPQKIQDFLDRLPANFESEWRHRDVAAPRDRRRAWRIARKARCSPPRARFPRAAAAWLMDMRALPSDQDHIVTLFRERGLWGAISKTNHAILRWRDPIYRSVRELAMSYAHEYCLPGGKKSMLDSRSRFRLRATRRGAGSSHADDLTG